MRELLIGLIIFIITGCMNKEISPIEIVKLDHRIINEIMNPENHDSMFVAYPKRKDFWSIEQYIIKPNKENAIFKDSVGDIVGYYKRIDGKNYETVECYPNGQLKGKLNYSEPGVIDGEAKYYYQDGRLKSIGMWNKFNRIGIWKNYDENGKLVLIEEFNEKGKLIEELKL